MPKFTSSKQTEDDIEEEIKRLSKDGFDVLLISAVKAIEKSMEKEGIINRI